MRVGQWQVGEKFFKTKVISVTFAKSLVSMDSEKSIVYTLMPSKAETLRCELVTDSQAAGCPVGGLLG